MSKEPESLVLELLRAMRGDVADVRANMATMQGVMATKTDIAELKSDMHSLRADVASDLLTFRKELGEQIVGLRRV